MINSLSLVKDLISENADVIICAKVKKLESEHNNTLVCVDNTQNIKVESWIRIIQVHSDNTITFNSRNIERGKYYN